MFTNIASERKHYALIALGVFTSIITPTIVSFKARTNQERLEWLVISIASSFAIYTIAHMYHFYLITMPSPFLNIFADDCIKFGNPAALWILICCFIGFTIRFVIDMVQYFRK